MIYLVSRFSVLIFVALMILSCDGKRPSEWEEVGPYWTFAQLNIDTPHVLVFQLDKCSSCSSDFRDDLINICLNGEYTLILITNSSKKADIYMKNSCNRYQILNQEQLIDSLKMNSAGKLFLKSYEDIKEIELDFSEDLQMYVND